MRFIIRVLGPLEVVHDGEPVAISREQVRTVLATLAATPGRPVSSDLLQFVLWPEAAPASPRSALQNRVFHARALFGDDGAEVIVAEGDAYRLSLDHGSVDLDDWFAAIADARRAVAAGRRDRGLVHFAEARALWRGRPFEGIAESEHLDRERRRLEQALTDVDLDEAETLRAAGRAPDAVALLTTTLDREPLREDVAQAVMTALDAAGRNADALRVAGRFGQRLRDELGASPSPSFDRLERRLLADPSGPGSPRRPSGEGPVWRRDQLARAAAEAADALAGASNRPVLVRSPPGHGLSTFLSRVALAVGDAVPTAHIHHVLHRVGAEHSLRRELALSVDDAAPRDRTLVQALDQLRESSADQARCVIVDDATELDPWSLELLGRLIDGPLPSNVALVVGLHSSDGRSSDEERRHDWLGRPDGMTLGRLQRADVELTLSAAEPDLSPSTRHRAAGRILDWCGGDPVAVLHAVDVIGRDGPDAPLPVPRPHAAEIARRLDGLDVETAALLRVAAHLGTGVDSILLAAVTETPIEDLVGRLSLAAARGILERASKPGWWAFPDRLTREAVGAGLDESTIVQTHAVAGRWLLDTRGDLGAAARHLVEGVPLVDTATAGDTARRAGELLMGEGSYEDAAFLFAKAAEIAPTIRDGDADRVATADALERTGDHDAANDIYDDVITRCGPDDLDRLATVAVGGAGRASRIGGQERRRHRLELAYPRLPAGHARSGDVAAELGLELFIAGRPIPPRLWDDLRRVADDAESPSRHLALRVRLVIEELRSGASIDDAEHLAELALAAIGERQDPLAGASLAVACHLAGVSGHWHRAESWVNELRLFGARSGEPRSRWQALAYRAALAEARGPEGAGDEIAAEALELGLQLGIANAGETHQLHLLGRALQSGVLSLAADELRRVGDPFRRFPVYFALLGLAELGRGDEAEARMQLAETAAALGRGEDTFRPPAIALGALLAAQLGDAETAGILVADLVPRAGRMVFLGYGGPFLGPVDWFRAVAAAATGDTAQAESLRAEALAAATRVGSGWQPPP